MRAESLLPAGHAKLEIAYVAGASRVLGAHAASPLRLLCPDVSPLASWVFTSSFGGGLVDGDALSLEVLVGGDAALLLLTQASTKVYRGAASQALSARVMAGALLVSAADPVVPFAGATYRQSIDVTLEEGGSCVVLDTYTAGRSERGERWAFSRYQSRTSLSMHGDRSLVDAVTLDLEHGAIGPRMGRFQAFSTLFLAGPRVEAAGAEIVRELAGQPVVPGAPVVAVASMHPSRATIVRIAASGVGEATAAARAMCRFLVPLVGEDPWDRRR